MASTCPGVADGRERHGMVWLVERDPLLLDANEFLVVNQFTVIEDKHNRRPDLVVFVNGLPKREQVYFSDVH